MPRSPLARIFRPTPRSLSRLAAALQRGELVGVPTETVYGLAANALDPAACRRIFRAKDRPTEDPLIVHIYSVAELDTIAHTNPDALRLAAKFWPGPLTMVLPKRDVIPAIVTAGRPSVAVRVPAHPALRALLRKTRLPLAAPSANPFGYISPTTADHVVQGLGRKIGYVLNGGPCSIGLESTIIDLRDPHRPRLLRPGAVTVAELERILGRAVAQANRSRRGAPQLAPGMMKRHYSPRTPVLLHDHLPVRRATADAWVFLARPAAGHGRNVFWLDIRGDLSGAARRLFALLRRLDQSGFRRIHVERARGKGLAAAINDRLSRAAAR
ncbi:MAG: threonylcarbamoyl-AMP synthase [Verrucomicrobia bacterium]|nr:threonylcarbamoyl-AMP synthase [Verrucomicrobiota bacterium]